MAISRVERVARVVNPRLCVIVGPTGSGKTALSLHLAEAEGGEIVSCDSVAVYRDLEIGTAKPSRGERARVPHHLIDVADPTETFTAGDYSRQARVAIADISGRGRVPIVVGGTGLYLRALLDGLFSGPERSEELRDRLRASEQRRGAGHLHRLLRRMDASAAEKIHANDVPKLIRAIEVCLQARAPMTQLWQQGSEPLNGFEIVKLGLDPDREKLYARINERCRRMFADGLVAETEQVRAKWGADVRPLQSLGYRQALAVLDGSMSEAQAIASMQQGHRNYAKRQLTWFRRESDVMWLKGFGDEPSMQSAALSAVSVPARATR